MGRFSHLATAGVAVIAILIALSQIRRQSTREPSWPVPSHGYNQEHIDYDAPKFPQARVVTVPTIKLAEVALLPLTIEIPNAQASHPLVFEGTIQHPLPVMGGFIKIRVAAPANSPQSRFNTVFDVVTATGTDGRLPYRAEGRVPGGKGVFEVEIEVEALAIASDQPKLATTIVAKGTIIVE